MKPNYLVDSIPFHLASFTFVVLNVMSQQDFNGLPCNFDRQSWSPEEASFYVDYISKLLFSGLELHLVLISIGLMSHLGQTMRSKFSHIE